MRNWTGLRVAVFTIIGMLCLVQYSYASGMTNRKPLRPFASSLNDATFADDQVFVADSVTAGTPRTLPSCTDTGGNHLNYNNSTNAFSCGTSSSSGGWTQNATDVNLTTATDNVGIGAASVAKLSVVGDANENQFVVRGFSTQTATILAVQSSDTSTLFSVSNDGSVTSRGTGTPGLVLQTGLSNYGITFDTVGTDTRMVGTSGNVSFSHTITVSGDGILMLTNTKGGILISDGTDFSPVAVGTNGQILSADSAATPGVRWTTIPSYDRGVVVDMTDAATITPDLDLGKIFRVTLGGNRTLGPPINGQLGRSYIFIVSQDATGSRTLGYSPFYRFGSDVTSPTLSTVAGTNDYLGMTYMVRGPRVSGDIVAVAKGYTHS